MRHITLSSTAALILASSAVMTLAQAQDKPPFERIPLQTTEWPPGYNSTSMTVKFQPGAVIPRHTHPGIESGYVQVGDLVIKIDGKPDVTAKAGGAWIIPADAIHTAAAGPNGATAIVTYVVDKTKPISSPAP